MEASSAKAFGKDEKVRPRTLCMQDELEGGNRILCWILATVYRAVEETVTARTAMSEVEAEAKRALARLAETRAECSE